MSIKKGNFKNESTRCCNKGEMMPKRIPVKALKELAKDQGLTHAVLYAHDGEREHIVSYGKTIDQCSQAADFGNSMKDFLGWPESLHAQPPRVRKLQKEIKELKSQKGSGLIKLEVLDYNADYAYVPPAKTAILNISDISSICEAVTRRTERCSNVSMKNGDQHVALGSPEEIYSKFS